MYRNLSRSGKNDRSGIIKLAQKVKSKIRRIHSKKPKDKLSERNFEEIKSETDSLTTKRWETQPSSSGRASFGIVSSNREVNPQNAKPVKKRRRRADRVPNQILSHRFVIDFEDLQTHENKCNDRSLVALKIPSGRNSNVKPTLSNSQLVDFTSSFDIKTNSELRTPDQHCQKGSLPSTSTVGSGFKRKHKLMTPVKRDRKEIPKLANQTESIHFTTSKLCRDHTIPLSGRKNICIKTNLEEDAAQSGNQRKPQAKSFVSQPLTAKKKPVVHSILKKFTPIKPQEKIGTSFVKTPRQEITSSTLLSERKKKIFSKQRSSEESSSRIKSKLGALFKKYGNPSHNHSKFL
ncbi:unnamed protein product [Moneuplotes crassus]|uniref:Uncharacterized protein n=1 Tax=Euplotes crassus TaxID=5936 RepID=A0AAD1UES8_EUPCR|nr:unnamed protein product [Moneuplotes crassus]